MKVGFIGAGKMAEAIMSALVASKTVGVHEIFASDVSAERRRFIKRRHGVNVYSKNHLVIDAVDIVVLAVKPQNLDDVCREIAPDITGKHLVISIAAGKRITSIETLLPHAKIVRVMPNLPSQVAEGISAFCAGTRATDVDKKTAASLLACFGKVIELPENLFDIVTAISGSGPAFFAYVLDRMVDAGVEEGMQRKDALLLAAQTMLGTSRLLIEQKLDPADLIKAVASPKGTTEAGLKVLESSPVADSIRATVRAATQRSRELSC